MKARTLVIVTLLCLSAAACSSTSKNHAAGKTSTKVSVADAAAEPGDAAAAGVTTTIAGAKSGAATKSGAAGKTGSAAGGGTAASARPTGPVLVGNYCQSAGQDIGIGGVSYGDCAKMANALAGWINSNGGAGGRQVKLVQVINDLTNTTPQDQQQQAACATLTEDKHVELAETNVASTDVVWTCLSQKGIPLFGGSNQNPDSSFFAKFPLFATQDAATDRLGVTQVDMLIAQGWWQKTNKVGLVLVDHPWYRNAAAAMKKRAGVHSLAFADEGTICYGCDSNTSTSQAQSIVAKFAAKGIDRVALIGSGASAFVQASTTANYFPRLGMNSELAPAIIALAYGDPRPWQGALSVGAYPPADVAAAQRPPLSPRTQQCHKILEDGGQSVNNPLVTWQGEFMCDGFFLLKGVMDLSRGRTDGQSISQAIASLGSGFASAGTWSTFFSPSRHDGAQAYRVTAFNTACNCFKYTTNDLPMTPLPGQPK